MLLRPAGARRWAGTLALSGTIALGGCASASSISPQDEAKIGAQYSSEINRQLPIVQDPQVHAYINQIGRSIASRVDNRLNYTFYVVNSDQINAFAIPGGYIYVNRGLIERSSNLSELAGVLGHEIGHVVERHGLEQMARMQNTQLGLNLGYILLGRAPGQLEQAAVGAAAQGLIIAPNSRAAENEADEVAVQYLIASGFHPDGLVSMFQTLINEQNRSPGSVEQWFSTHPLTQDRIEHVRSVISRTPGVSNRLTRDNRAFQSFKQRLQRLPAAPR